MKLNSSQLEAFSAIAKTLHFRKAAEILNVTQSALSQRIAKLEEDLETSLFIRNHNSIRLTEAGFRLLRFCELNSSAESEMLEDLKGSQASLGGVIRIAGFSSVNRSLVIPAMRDLMAKNNQLSIQLMTRELRDLADLLQRGEADYILTNQISTSAEVENIFLGFEENVLVRSKKFSANGIFLDHDENDPVTTGYFSQNQLKQEPRKMRYLDDVYGLIDGVKNGYGQAILPKHLVENERELEVVSPKTLLRVKVFLQFYSQPFYKRTHEPVVRSLTDYFKDRLRQK
jgi:DNA-binding transcriptional LysR family regulator